MPRRLALAALVLTTAVSSAHAQLSAVIGKPLPSSDLPAGTISVRVVDGSVAAPHANLVVTLVVGAVHRTATTDAAGRATFDKVKLGALVNIIAAKDQPLGVSEAFVVPSDGGTRVMLSTTPLHGIDVPAPRASSGHPHSDDVLAPGVVEVRLTYDSLADPKPPQGVVVSLVGYGLGDRIDVVTATTDRTGLARFTQLDHRGATAYFATAQLPRNHAADRLISEPFVLGKTGFDVTLSAELRTSTGRRSTS